ncbi:hypothetical protein F4777DRAFT_575791 [Nemania sp. FL0916]|nr:hypothetical protein F4777DRAFT_575791 [Nemania sp. FL0916]
MAALSYTILIIGGTGAIGKHITNSIVSAGVTAGHSISLFTSEATASSPDKSALLTSWKSKGLRIITGDVNSADDVSHAYEGVDVVVSCLGRNTLAVQVELVKLAEQSKSVKWFFPSEYGTDIEYDETSPAEKPHQHKLKVRKFIRENIRRVHCTYLVTGPYIDMFMSQIPGAEAAGGFEVRGRKAVLVDDGKGPIGFTSMPDVGKLLVASLHHPDESYGKALKVQSFVTTPLEILDEFKKQTGDNWAVEHTSLQELRDLEKRMWDEGSPIATGPTLRRIWAEGRTLYDKTDNESLGLKPDDMEPLSQVVARFIEARK